MCLQREVDVQLMNRAAIRHEVCAAEFGSVICACQGKFRRPRDAKRGCRAPVMGCFLQPALYLAGKNVNTSAMHSEGEVYPFGTLSVSVLYLTGKRANNSAMHSEGVA